MTTLHDRIFGLDVLRAAAILLVVFDHNADVLGWFSPGVPAGSGIDGVDLFFVLSGYLIGSILLKYAALDGVPWWRRVLDFWQRRWLRTLPNYYLFLVINILLLAGGVTEGVLNHNTWAYVFFLQYLWKSLDLFFWESWSLVVEEWFYLLFPLALSLVLAAIRTTVRKGFLLAVMCFIVVPLLVRFLMAPDVSRVFDLELGARHLVITRLDSIGFGMLMAWAMTILMRASNGLRSVLFLLGFALLVLNSWAYGDDALYYSSTWFFTVNAMASALLLPFLSTLQRVPRGGGVVVFVSKVSYAMYLVHLPVRAVWNRLYWERGVTEGLLLWVCYWLVCFGISWLVYRFWEKRFMDLRDGLGRRVLGAPTPSS